MVSANGAPTGSPAMAAADEWVPPPLWSSSPQVYTRITRAGQISVSQNVFKNYFFSLLKKKFSKKISITYIPFARYNTVAKPQLLPSNMLHIVDRLHNISAVLNIYCIHI